MKNLSLLAEGEVYLSSHPSCGCRTACRTSTGDTAPPTLSTLKTKTKHRTLAKWRAIFLKNIFFEKNHRDRQRGTLAKCCAMVIFQSMVCKRKWEKRNLRSSFKEKAGLGKSGSHGVSSWWLRPRKLHHCGCSLGCFSQRDASREGDEQLTLGLSLKVCLISLRRFCSWQCHSSNREEIHKWRRSAAFC